MSLAHYAAIIRDLNACWTPHDKQRIVLQALFSRNIPLAMVECGRKWGKSEIECYTLWRWALTRPGQYYYFAPFQKQAMEIIWKSGRIQTFGPKQYIAKINEAEGRITFTNGSFIKLDGTDNFEAYRGVNPHGIVLDEFKDSRQEFWVAMEPNLATHKAQCLWGGTPPETDQPFLNALIEEAKEQSGYFNYTTYDNPHIDPAWIDKKKRDLYARGDGAVFEREYMARRVFGGLSSIIPMFDRKRHIRPHAALVREVKNDARHLEWFVICDPGTATVFGVLFGCYNPYRKTIYLLDEMYVEKQSETSVSNIMPRLQVMRMEYPSSEWLQVYDEAAIWFANEAASTYDEHFIPTNKAQNKKEDGLSLIKDQLLNDRAIISDRCVKLAWEVENYVKDKHGRIPKDRDHLIDCWRYANAAVGFDLADDDPAVAVEDDRRAYTMDEDLKNDSSDFDPMNDMISMEDIC